MPSAISVARSVHATVGALRDHHAGREPGIAADPELRKLRTLSRVLDGGVDPVLGMLLPGVGDVLGTVLGLGIVASASRRKLPPVVIARMLMNLAVDALVGAVPLVGDIFDFAFQAPTKNVALLTERHRDPRSSWKDWVAVGGALAFLVLAIVAAGYLAWRLTAWACGQVPTP